MATDPVFQQSSEPTKPERAFNDYKDSADFHERASLLELAAWQLGWNEYEDMLRDLEL